MSHLTYDERKRIEQFLLAKYASRDIARQLGRHHSVINREIRRNSGHFPYAADQAQLRYQKRLGGKKQTKLATCPQLKNYVIKKLQKDWSPEQIAGRIKKYEYRYLQSTISHETVYQFIYSQAGRSLQLFTHLRTKRPRRWQKCSRRKKLTMPDRTSIHQRPEEVSLKIEPGHWETDLMIFRKQKTCLSVDYEKSWQLCRLHKTPDKTAISKYEAIVSGIDSLPLWLYKTMTFDNGSENVKHTDLKKQFGLQTYFCDAYRSWQKGGVENLNKLIRQYLPRWKNLSNYTEEDISKIQELLNNRPRKGLNYLTPNEMLLKHTSGAFNT
jgi:IS30 family transposase